ncbi:L-seryl-tRNA(Sec) selenium transferase [Fictibacillus sp. NRS-1165]|uniref:L-seryl-tRNA(Sec) selenium transferase n=1 Tax=Fictibacillus sp. NRS-1165 TaxID=3144463 RepID=UPI003D25A579
MKDKLRRLPAVNTVIQAKDWQKGTSEVPAEVITKWIQEEIAAIRHAMQVGSYNGGTEQSELLTQVCEAVNRRLAEDGPYLLRRVINATGVVLHTNLGRARLSQAAAERVAKAAASYTNLEFNLEDGERGSRHAVIENQITAITGSEAAMVVNNNAAAVYFILSVFAKEKEVIVSRGELVEIGGSFRVSSIMKESGAHLMEVGTTNKTHMSDYEQALSSETAMIMKVHSSNFTMRGFTKSISAAELTALKKQHPELLIYEDMGSGSLFPFSNYKIGDEPEIKPAIQSGIDLISFSGDKLLGGPQAGIIAGKKELINTLKKHQLARVLRVDKLTLSALEATLLAYHNEERTKEIPAIRDMLKTPEELKTQAERIAEQLERMYCCHVREGTSLPGGGTMPDVLLPTYIIEVTAPNLSPSALAKELRRQRIPVIVNVKNNSCVIDPRTLDEKDERDLVSAFLSV